MQLYVAIFCVIGTTSFLMSMQEQKRKACLNFLVDSNQRVIRYSKQNMEYFIQQNEFICQDITMAIPLDEKDRQAVKLGFVQAREKKETVKVPCVLDTTNFVAKITPLVRENSNVNYFVKVQEAKK